MENCDHAMAESLDESTSNGHGLSLKVGHQTQVLTQGPSRLATLVDVEGQRLDVSTSLGCPSILGTISLTLCLRHWDRVSTEAEGAISTNCHLKNRQPFVTESGRSSSIFATNIPD